MKFKSLIILLALNLAAFGLIVGLKKHQEKALSELPVGIRLQPSIFDSLQTLTIHSPYLTKERQFVRKQQEWWITSPIEWPANPFAIQKLLNQLEFLEHEVSFKVADILAAGQTLADYGLDEPVLQLTLANGNEDFIIKIGQNRAEENRVYVLEPQAEEILVASNQFLEPFLMDLSLMRSNQLFQIPPFEVQELVIQMLQPATIKMRLIQNQRQWSFEAPFSAPAQNESVDATLATLASLPIVQFLNQPSPEMTGLQTPSLTITQIGLDRRETLYIGNRFHQTGEIPQVYAQFEGNQAIFTLPAEPLEALQELQNDLREKRILTLSFSDVDSIQIADAAQSLKLERLETGAWNLKTEDGSSKPADEPAIQDLFDQLQSIEAIGFPADTPSSKDLEDFGLNQPQKTIMLKGTAAEVLYVGKTDIEGHTYIRKESRPTVYKVKADNLNPIETNPLSYKSRWVEVLPKNYSLQSLQFAALDAADTPLMSYATQGDPQEDWDKFLKSLTPPKAQAIQSLIGSLSHFRVRSHLAEKFNPQLALEEPQPLPWKYRLQIHAQNLSNEEFQDFYVFFSERMDAQLQIGGTPHGQITFALSATWLDALAQLIP
jgi:hypothetical protein